MSDTFTVGPADPASASASRPSRPAAAQDEEIVFTRVLKLFNITVAVITIAFAIYCYFGFRPPTGTIFSFDDPCMFILPGYVALSGLIILAVETETKIVHRNMSFLLNYIGRGLFNIYVALLCLSMVIEVASKDPQRSD